MYDVIIIGSGPAGMAAAIYAARACLRTLLLERQPMGGGQILNSSDVDNYPGIPDISGFELGQKLMEHMNKLGIRQVTEEVIRLDCMGEVKRVVTANAEYEAKNLIYAAGAGHRKLGAAGEERLAGMGVSYCATCDGAFFRGKTAAVVGGGDVALEDALFLAKLCKKVWLIHRRDTFRGAKTLEERVRAAENVELVLEAVVESIDGDEKVEGLTLRRKGSGTKEKLATDAVFIAVGMTPHTDLIKDQVETDENGYIIAGENCRTNRKGVYAAGDVRTKALRQIITAACDGANAVADLITV